MYLLLLLLPQIAPLIVGTTNLRTYLVHESCKDRPLRVGWVMQDLFHKMEDVISHARIDTKTLNRLIKVIQNWCFSPPIICVTNVFIINFTYIGAKIRIWRCLYRFKNMNCHVKQRFLDVPLVLHTARKRRVRPQYCKTREYVRTTMVPRTTCPFQCRAMHACIRTYSYMYNFLSLAKSDCMTLTRQRRRRRQPKAKKAKKQQR